MKKEKISVLAVQETHLSESRVKDLNSQFDRRIKIYNLSDGDITNAKGVAIVIDYNLVKAGTVTTERIVPGRAILTTIPWKNGNSKLSFLAIYAPNGREENATFWEDLTGYFRRRRQDAPRPDFMLGDFNVTEDDIDRLPPRPDTERAVSALQELREELGLTDGWRMENPDGVMYSWSRASNQPGNEMESSAKESPYLGRGRWTIPDYLLKDEQFLGNISKIGKKALEEAQRIADERRTATQNPQLEWKKYKNMIRHAAQERARKEMPATERKIKDLTTRKNEILNDRRKDDHEKVSETTAIDAYIRTGGRETQSMGYTTQTIEKDQ
ncbi:Endonuclease/exonuclease/phosphatase [Coprinopsis sp. MPI-PUGE-AT-0042]|nr:Endonuclease/exonuclease/phosphatase [Coprinopsis sp. MPI-PUGE-AT-0042]